MVNAIVQSGRTHGPAINVMFVIVTASPATYISRTALTALGLGEDAVRPCTLLDVHGVSSSVYVSPATGHFSEANVIGASFLEAVRAGLAIDYQAGTVSIFAPAQRARHTEL